MILTNAQWNFNRLLYCKVDEYAAFRKRICLLPTVLGLFADAASIKMMKAKYGKKCMALYVKIENAK